MQFRGSLAALNVTLAFTLGVGASVTLLAPSVLAQGASPQAAPAPPQAAFATPEAAPAASVPAPAASVPAPAASVPAPAASAPAPAASVPASAASAPAPAASAPAPAASAPAPAAGVPPIGPTPVPFGVEPPGTPGMGEAVGRVLRVVEGTIVVGRESAMPLRPGDNLGFRDEFGDERIVGSIRSVNLSTYNVHVQVNEEVHVGELAYRTPSPPSARLVAPPQGNFLGSFGLTLRPWLGLDGKDSGVLIDGFARVQIANHLRLAVAVDPAAPRIGNTPGMVEAYAAPMITFRLAEIGFGIGAGSANNNTTGSGSELGVLLTPILGIGAEDGFKLRVRSSAIAHSGRTTFGSLRADMEIPVSYGMRLMFGGGGGDSGYAYGELGFKMLVAGVGGANSWLVHGVFGYGGTRATQVVTSSGYIETITANGPYLGLGFEYRFGKRPGGQH